MDFGLAITGNISKEKSTLIIELSDNMNKYFEDKSYGNDVKSYTIGIVCVAPQFDQFFKGGKPKYTKGKKTINYDGIPFTLEDSFEYSIKIDYEIFNKGTETECVKLLAKEILESVSIIEGMKTKIKDFNTQLFKNDIETLFKSHGYI